MVVGTFLFAVVAGFAVLVWIGTQWLARAGVPYYISMGAEGVAILFFALDILCLALFVIAETLKLLRFHVGVSLGIGGLPWLTACIRAPLRQRPSRLRTTR